MLEEKSKIIADQEEKLTKERQRTEGVSWLLTFLFSLCLFPSFSIDLHLSGSYYLSGAFCFLARIISALTILLALANSLSLFFHYLSLSLTLIISLALINFLSLFFFISLSVSLELHVHVVKM